MTWANFDDNFADHPKVLALSDGAFRLHVSGILYCARYLTDGKVPKAKVSGLTPGYKAAHLRELTVARLWTAPVGGPVTHYEIHDYLQWNRSRSSILTERERKAEAGRRGARRRWTQ